MTNEMNLGKLVDPTKAKQLIGAMMTYDAAIKNSAGLGHKHFINPVDYGLYYAIQEVFTKTTEVPTKGDVLSFLEVAFEKKGGTEKEIKEKLNASEITLDYIIEVQKGKSEKNSLAEVGDIITEMKMSQVFSAGAEALVAGGEIKSIAETMIQKWDKCGTTTKRKLIDQSKDMAESLRAAGKFEDGISFGIREIDEKKNINMPPGSLTMFVAPSNVGKSWFCVHINNHCKAIGKSVLYITLEMLAEKVQQRIAANLTGKDVNLTDTDEMIAAHQAKLDELGDSLSDCSLDAFPTKTATLLDIEICIEAHKENYGSRPDLVIIDGISEIGLNPDEKPYDGLGRIAAGFHRIANEHKCAVLTTAQTNRQGFADNIVKLTAEHMGDSVQPFQRADTVISMTRHSSGQNKANLYIAKARSGMMGEVFVIDQRLDRGLFCLKKEDTHISDNTPVEEEKIKASLQSPTGDRERRLERTKSILKNARNNGK